MIGLCDNTNKMLCRVAFPKISLLLENRLLVSGLEACLRSFFMWDLITSSSTGIPSVLINCSRPVRKNKMDDEWINDGSKDGCLHECMVHSEWIYGLMSEWMDDHIIWTYMYE